MTNTKANAAEMVKTLLWWLGMALRGLLIVAAVAAVVWAFSAVDDVTASCEADGGTMIWGKVSFCSK